MKNFKKALPFLLIAIGTSLIALGCSSETVTVTVPVVETVEVVVTEVVPEEVIVEVTPEVPPGPEVPFLELWASSGHADASAEAFRHWDEDEPAEVPARCAKCHTPDGYIDYVGADGSTVNMIDAEAHMPADMGVTCVACHNSATVVMTSVVMPSGIELMGLGDESRCMQCHQGRSSTFTVATAIEEAGVGDDEVSEDLGFINIHYYAAAATKYGTLAKGGYEYEGKSYDGFFAHVEGKQACIGCHDPHTLQIKINECQACHDVETAEDFKDVRYVGSLVDYDGDGDMSEGVFYEIQGLQEILYGAIQAYSAGLDGGTVVYDAASYPYFFDEAGERYGSWTPRLVKAAYNYQVSLKDPGEHAHGGKYIIQLLYDSIEDLDASLVEGLSRIDHGHFAGSEEAFRHWDEDGEVPGRCSRCHSAEGLPLFLEQGVTINQHVSNGFQCATCHNDLETFTRYEASSVTFPSGATITVEEGDNAGLCMTCHQGRSSKASVDGAVGDSPDNTVAEGLNFINIHYFAAGATRYGTQVQGAYEFDGNDYLGYFEHVPAANDCTECHNTHTQQVEVELCSNCHEGVDSKEALMTIRVTETDFDGDGDATEGLFGEIDTMCDVLYEAIQAYANATDGVEAIVYDSHSYPYFFIDTNGDGVPTPDEANFGNRFGTWTPNLLRAAYNYQYALKDPGAFAHNGLYVIQILYDSIAAMGGDVSAMTRPAVP